MRYILSTIFLKIQIHENVTLEIALHSKTRLPQVTPQRSSTNLAKLTPRQSNLGETKTMGATTLELGPVGF